MARKSKIETQDLNGQAHSSAEDSETQVAGEPYTTTVAQVAAGFIADMPDVMPHVENPRVADTLEISPDNVSGGYIKDARGTVFNPQLHATDKNGAPKLTKSGYFRKRTGVNPAEVKAIDTQDSGKPPVDPEKCKRFARQMVFLLEFGSMQIAGPDCADEWRMHSDEKDALNEAAETYAIEKGLSDLPPTLGLVLAVGMYILPRFYPGTKTQAKFNEKLKALPFFKKKNKVDTMEQALKDSVDNAYSNSGDYGNG